MAEKAIPFPASGTLYAVGVGPGDPELLTVKAVLALQQADVVAYHCAPGKTSHALSTVTPYLTHQRLLELSYPVTTGPTLHPGGYQTALAEFYDESEAQLRAELNAGHSVALIAAGDPLIYSSQQHLSRRLADDFPLHIIPGISSFSAAAAAAQTVLCEDRDILRIIPATLSPEELRRELSLPSPVAILKLGRTTQNVVEALEAVGRLDQAMVVANASTPEETVAPLVQVLSDGARLPYFSVVLLPSQTIVDGVKRVDYPPSENPGVECKGRVDVIGLGPGGDHLRTPDTSRVIAQATDFVGYSAYVERVHVGAGQKVHASGNMVEIERAQQALQLAAEGRRVVIVSSGDPGVFGMATALMEVIDNLCQEDSHHPLAQLPITIHPGVTAALAAASLAGAPLGHDFAIISLSDRLKPWEVIEQRVQALCKADMAFAVYNPKSQARPHQIDDLLTLLKRHREPSTLIIKARAVGCEQEQYSVTTLGEFSSEDVDMRTVLIVGSTRTRAIAAAGHSWVYTPRRYD